jgi:hypothetical protein
LTAYGPLNRPQIVKGNVLEAWEEWLESLLIFGLSRRSQGGDRSPVKPPLHRDDLDPLAVPLLLGVLPGQLNGRLVGLGAAITKEDPIGKGVLTQELG